MKNLVLFTTDITTRAGESRAVALLANELINEYNVTILSLYNLNLANAYNLDKKIKTFNLFEGRVNIKKNYFKVRRRFEDWCKGKKIEVLIIESLAFNCFLFYFLIKNKEIKSIGVEHGSLLDRGRIFGLKWTGRLLGLLINNYIVVLTKSDLNHYKNKFRFFESKIFQIYNIADNNIRINNYNMDSKYIMSCGRLEKVKGYDKIIEKADKIFKKHPNWQLHIYGDGSEKENLLNLIHSKNLEKNIFLMGETNNIYSKYKQYSFYIQPSLFESFGLALIESLKSGVPVISFDCPHGPREIIDNNNNGYLIPNGDIESFINSIIYLIENPYIRNELASNSLITLKKFEASNIKDKWMYLLNE